MQALFLAGSQVIMAASEDGDDWGSIGYVFLLSGVVFYLIMYHRYRNTHKRHRHESETEAKRVNEVVHDQFLKQRKGLTSSTMSGANHEQVRGALNRPAFSAEQLLGRVGINPNQIPNSIRGQGPSR